MVINIFDKLRSKIVIGGIIALVLIPSCLMVYSVLNKGTNEVEENGNMWRTEKQPIIDRFPGIGGFDKCYWKADVTTKDSRLSAPGPTSYWMKGFVVLDSKEFNNLKQRFKWEAVKSGWTPSLDTSILKVQSLHWFYSREFNDYVKKQSFLGDFYLDFENGVIFFDVQK